MAEGFVTMNRVKSQSLENSHLEDEVNPRITDEHRKEEDTNTRVEGQDVAKGHERQTFPTKLLTHWVIYWQLLNQWTKQLKLRCLTLLRTHVPNIKEEVELLEPLLPVPVKAVHPLLHLNTRIEFAPLFAKRYPKMHVAIIICYAALARMAKETCPKDDEENPNTPNGIEPDGNADVNANEPQLASKTIENTAHKGRLASHSGQLTVGTIVPVCPNEHEHANEVVTKVAGGKEISRSTANHDAQQRDDNGMNVQPTEEQRPQITWGASDVEFEIALCVTRLHCSNNALS